MTTDQETIRQMFDRIASTYDLANRVLSFGQDKRWRNVVVGLVPKTKDLRVLDIATGTADLLIAMCNACPNIREAYGIDTSRNMLSAGLRKVKESGNHITLKMADACALPFSDASIDVITISFGIRNILERDTAIKEVARVLSPNGLFLCLEFSMPKNWFIKNFYLLYFRHILPFVGGLISKHKDAYSYLNRTVEAFPCPSRFSEILMQNGFNHVDKIHLAFGISTIYCARKAQ